MQAIATRTGSPLSSRPTISGPSNRLLLLFGSALFVGMLLAARLVEWSVFGGDLFSATSPLPAATLARDLGSLAAHLWPAVPLLWVLDRGLRRRRAGSLLDLA